MRLWGLAAEWLCGDRVGARGGAVRPCVYGCGGLKRKWSRPDGRAAGAGRRRGWVASGQASAPKRIRWTGGTALGRGSRVASRLCRMWLGRASAMLLWPAWPSVETLPAGLLRSSIAAAWVGCDLPATRAGMRLWFAVCRAGSLGWRLARQDGVHERSTVHEPVRVDRRCVAAAVRVRQRRRRPSGRTGGRPRRGSCRPPPARGWRGGRGGRW